MTQTQPSITPTGKRVLAEYERLQAQRHTNAQEAPMREIQVPVIIDVTARDAEHAAQVAVQVLADAKIVGAEANGGNVESWWTVEEVAKEADGNDNEHGVVVFENDLDYLYIVLRRAGVVPPGQRERHDRLVRYFAKGNRCGSADDRDATDDDL